MNIELDEVIDFSKLFNGIKSFPLIDLYIFLQYESYDYFKNIVAKYLTLLDYDTEFDTAVSLVREMITSKDAYSIIELTPTNNKVVNERRIRIAREYFLYRDTLICLADTSDKIKKQYYNLILTRVQTKIYLDKVEEYKKERAALISSIKRRTKGNTIESINIDKMLLDGDKSFYNKECVERIAEQYEKEQFRYNSGSAISKAIAINIVEFLEYRIFAIRHAKYDIKYNNLTDIAEIMKCYKEANMVAKTTYMRQHDEKKPEYLLQNSYINLYHYDIVLERYVRDKIIKKSDLGW